MTEIGWNDCRIAVFDIDGTLYDSAPMRRLMALMVGWHAATRFNPRLIRVISMLRRRREALADAERAGFEAILITEVAKASRLSETAVRTVLDDWFDRRPLPYIARYLVPGAPQLFDALRRNGLQIGVLSDHRAAEKLAALGLSADFILSAVDAEVDVQKPNPKGLQLLLERAGRKPAEAIMIGDRADRDGAIAARAGTRFLLRGAGSDADFQRFDDPVFAPILKKAAVRQAKS